MTAAEREKDMEDKKTYKEAFDDFDWNKNGTIPCRVSPTQYTCQYNTTNKQTNSLFCGVYISSLYYATQGPKY